MLGFIIGAACVVGVARLIRRRAWYGRFGYGGYSQGCSPMHSMRHQGMGRRGPRSSGGRWALRSLFERLETTPGQERVILGAFDELRDNRKSLRDEFKQTRVDLAHAVEGGLIEDATLEEAYARHDRMLAQLRVGFTEVLKKVVEVLDEPQRKELASLLEGGFFRGGWGGPGQVWA